MNRCTKSISLVLLGSAVALAGCQSNDPPPCPDQGEDDWARPEEKQPGDACYGSRYRGGGTTHPRGFVPIIVGGRRTTAPGGVKVPSGTARPGSSAGARAPGLGGTARGGFGGIGASAGAHASS